MIENTAGLELIAAKLGVAASDLWALWISLWWRPWLSIGTEIVAIVLLAWATLWCARKHQELEAARGYNDNPMYAIGGFGAAFMVLLLVVCFLTELPDAIVYTFNHNAYAVDQLRGLLRGGSK